MISAGLWNTEGLNRLAAERAQRIIAHGSIIDESSFNAGGQHQYAMIGHNGCRAPAQTMDHTGCFEAAGGWATRACKGIQGRGFHTCVSAASEDHATAAASGRLHGRGTDVHHISGVSSCQSWKISRSI